MNKPLAQLKTLPRPAVSDLRALRKILDEAREVKDDHWSHDLTMTYLNDAQHLIDGGEWSRALAHAKKAEANEGQYSKRNLAEQYHTLLKGLYIAYAQHQANNDLQKESLRAELAEKKERKDEPTTGRSATVPLSEVRRGEDGGPPGSVHDRGRDVGDTANGDPASAVPTPSVPGALVIDPGSNSPALDRGVVGRQRADPSPQKRPLAAQSSDRKDSTPDHPYLISQKKNKLRQDYWDAIISREVSKIERAAKACKEMGLDDVLAETRYQLTKIEETIFLIPRQHAVRAWEAA